MGWAMVAHVKGIDMEVVIRLTLTPEQVHDLIKEEEEAVLALKNHIASAVEAPNHWEKLGGATALVKKLRFKEDLLRYLRVQLREELT